MPVGQNSFITDPSNNVAVVAPLGNVYTNEAFPILIASYHMSITGASGGTNLPNVPCGKVEIQNLSGNGVMWIGGVAQSAPYSGRGYELLPMSAPGHGEKTMYVTNANQISVCAFFSGQLLSFLAYGNAMSTVISPGTQGTAPNLTPPLLSGTTPLSGLTDVGQGTSIVYTFNEPLDPNNCSGIYVVGSGQTNPAILGHLGGVLTYFSGATTATFQPNSGQLQLSGWYIPMVDPSVEGFNGIPLSGGIAASGSPFQIQGPPIVSGQTPVSGTTNVSGGQNITITFSETMKASTINLSGIFLAASGALTPHISGMVSLLNSNPTIAQFTPISGTLGLSGVSTSTWYIPFVTTEVTDTFGNSISTFFSGQPFETAAAASPPDTTPPRVSGTSPISGATNVVIVPTIQVTMSEAVNSGLVTANTVRVHDIQTSDVNVVGTVSLQSDLLTIDWKPNAALSDLHLHRMELSGIQDLAGNFMTPFSGATFTTEPVLQVSGSTPASGASAVAISPTIILSMDRAVNSGTVSTSTVGLTDLSGNIQTLASVSLTSDNLTIAYTPNQLGYLASYYIQASGVLDLLQQEYMIPFSGAIFTTTAPALIQVYNVTGTNTEGFGHGSANDLVIAQGEGITSNSAPMFGKVIKQAQFQLQRVGNPTGTLTCVVLDKNQVIRTILGSIPAASVSTTATSYTFTNLSGSYAMGTNDNVLIQYPLAGTSNGNYINMFYNNGNSYVATTYVADFTTSPAGFATEPDDISAIFSY